MLNLQELVRAKLARPQQRPRLQFPWPRHGNFRQQHSRQLKQRGHQSEVSRSPILAHRNWVWHHCLRPRLHKSYRRRCSSPFLKIIVTNNKLQSYIFQDKKLKVTARQVRSKGAVAISDKEAQLENPSKPSSIVTSFPTPSYAPSSAYSQATSPIKKSPVRRFMHNARQSILPSYRSEVPPYPRTPPGGWPTSPVKAAKTGESEEAAPMEISAPLNVNPQFAHLVRPNLAHHPTNRRGDGSF